MKANKSAQNKKEQKQSDQQKESLDQVGHKNPFMEGLNNLPGNQLSEQELEELMEIVSGVSEDEEEDDDE